jgi:hypothetical protein
MMLFIYFITQHLFVELLNIVLLSKLFIDHIKYCEIFYMVKMLKEWALSRKRHGNTYLRNTFTSYEFFINVESTKIRR